MPWTWRPDRFLAQSFCNDRVKQRFADGEDGVWKGDYGHWESSAAQETGEAIGKEYSNYRLLPFSQSPSLSVLFDGAVYLDGVLVDNSHAPY